jgi:small subunit ribosomal protein S30e
MSVLYLLLGYCKIYHWVLQEQVAKLESIPVGEFCLYCSGCPLSEDALVANLQSFSIDVSVPLKGGKVHGSLARAGKVKGQTPKVRENNKFQQFIYMLIRN